MYHMYHNHPHLPVSLNILLALLVLWSVAWKIYAAWMAAKHNHKRWFVAIILLNTASLLEMFYVFKIANKSYEQVKSDWRRAFEKKLK